MEKFFWSFALAFVVQFPRLCGVSQKYLYNGAFRMRHSYGVVMDTFNFSTGEPVSDQKRLADFGGFIGRHVLGQNETTKWNHPDYLELDSDSKATIFPWQANALVVIYNVPGLVDLKMDTSLLLSIFSGDIKQWNHTSIQGTNFDARLPNKPINIIVRRDESATTYLLTLAFSRHSQEWAAKYGTFLGPKLLKAEGPSANWPKKGPHQYYANTELGMIFMVQSIPFSIGYVTYRTAEEYFWGVNIVTLINSLGQPVAPLEIVNGIHVTLGFFEADLLNDWFVDVLDASLRKAYSLTMVEYVQLKAIDKWCDALNSWKKNLDGSPSAQSLIPESVIGAVQSKLQSRNCKSWHHPNGEQEQSIIGFIVLGSVIAMVITVVLAGLTYRYHIVPNRWMMSKRKLTIGQPITTLEDTMGQLGVYRRRDSFVAIGRRTPQVIQSSSIRPTTTSECTTRTTHTVHFASVCSTDDGAGLVSKVWQMHTGTTRGKSCLLFESPLSRLPKLSAKFLQSWIKEFRYPNLQPLSGFMVQDSTLIHVYKLDGKTTSLHHVLASCVYELGEEVQYSFAHDICNGMDYLHQNGIFHGFLDTWNILLDATWLVKVANWAQTSLLEVSDRLAEISANELGRITNRTELQRNVFRHPDILNNLVGKPTHNYHKKYDHYSYAMVLLEIFSREVPFADKALGLGWQGVIRDITDYMRFPALTDALPMQIRKLLDQLLKCQLDTSFESIRNILQLSRPENFEDSVKCNILLTLESYITKLNFEIESKSHELVDASCNFDLLLRSILPEPYAVQLQRGEGIKPQFYETVSVCSCALAKFAQLVPASEPYEMTEFLNDLFVYFDEVAQKFQVHTISANGDEYLFASGLPEENGTRHAREIVGLSLALLREARMFLIKHKPKTQLELKFGISSGPVIAGVIGSKVPKLCIFGECVDLAQELRNFSRPNKILIAEQTARVLETDSENQFSTEFFREMEFSASGKQQLYRVVEKANPNAPVPLITVDPESSGTSIASTANRQSLSPNFLYCPSRFSFYGI